MNSEKLAFKIGDIVELKKGNRKIGSIVQLSRSFCLVTENKINTRYSYDEIQHVEQKMNGDFRCTYSSVPSRIKKDSIYTFKNGNCIVNNILCYSGYATLEDFNRDCEGRCRLEEVVPFFKSDLVMGKHVVEFEDGTRGIYLMNGFNGIDGGSLGHINSIQEDLKTSFPLRGNIVKVFQIKEYDNRSLEDKIRSASLVCKCNTFSELDCKIKELEVKKIEIELEIWRLEIEKVEKIYEIE